MTNAVVTRTSKTAIGVVITTPANILPQVTYEYAFLMQQLVDIQAQKDRDSAQRDIEIANVLALLSECNKLGIMSAVTPIIK